MALKCSLNLISITYIQPTEAVNGLVGLSIDEALPKPEQQIKQRCQLFCHSIALNRVSY